mgnify:CR=1 FL=1
MPKVYSVVEVRSRSWGLVVAALTFFISLSLVLGILLPAEQTRRKDAEEARERLTMHAHRLAQAREELQKQLMEEKQNKEAILAMLLVPKKSSCAAYARSLSFFLKCEMRMTGIS